MTIVAVVFRIDEKEKRNPKTDIVIHSWPWSGQQKPLVKIQSAQVVNIRSASTQRLHGRRITSVVARKPDLPGIKQLVINLDNGLECNGRRSQFLLRMTEIADMTGLCVRLVYYPPYHSKYNAIERYWAGLEKSWNGYLLSTVDTVINRAGNFYWKGMRTMACLVDVIYEKGVKLCGNEKRSLEHRLQRSTELNWWDITIPPKTVLL